jgi:hypothetical protein
MSSPLDGAGCGVYLLALVAVIAFVGITITEVIS